MNDTDKIEYPWQALRAVEAVLRKLGYTIDNTTARREGAEAFEVDGQLVKMTSARWERYGAFQATVSSDGDVDVTAGAFGRYTLKRQIETLDAFHGL